MSRIGKKPVTVLDGVKIAIEGNNIKVEGPKGKLSFAHSEGIRVAMSADGKEVDVTRDNDD
jgi:large subunit ribosomal protein L6